MKNSKTGEKNNMETYVVEKIQDEEEEYKRRRRRTLLEFSFGITDESKKVECVCVCVCSCRTNLHPVLFPLKTFLFVFWSPARALNCH